MSVEQATTDALKQKVFNLRLALEKTLPEFPGLLQEIHSHIKATPELGMVLSEEEIGILVAGYERQTGIVIIAEKMKSTKKLKGSDISVDMI